MFRTCGMLVEVADVALLPGTRASAAAPTLKSCPNLRAGFCASLLSLLTRPAGDTALERGVVREAPPAVGR